MSSVYHESASELSPQARDVHRALTSLIEELEAIDYYQQRADVTKDEALKGVLIHNRNEEIEHASMILEWLRRLIPEFDQDLHTYLFTSGNITDVEKGAKSESPSQAGDGSLGIATSGKGE